MIAIDWYLEDIDGALHRASFVECRSKNDFTGMKWDRRISWSKELTLAKQDGRQMYKLIDAIGRVHGGISMRDAGDHVFVHLIESATHNRYDPRMFVNVSRLLIAYAGRRSIDIGADGFLKLMPKTDLYDYYADRFKAFPLPRGYVGIADYVTKRLIGVYYK